MGNVKTKEIPVARGNWQHLKIVQKLLVLHPRKV
jgi:hypothetical protein